MGYSENGNDQIADRYEMLQAEIAKANKRAIGYRATSLAEMSELRAPELESRKRFVELSEEWLAANYLRVSNLQSVPGGGDTLKVMWPRNIHPVAAKIIDKSLPELGKAKSKINKLKARIADLIKMPDSDDDTPDWESLWHESEQLISMSIKSPDFHQRLRDIQDEVGKFGKRLGGLARANKRANEKLELEEKIISAGRDSIANNVEDRNLVSAVLTKVGCSDTTARKILCKAGLWKRKPK
jgi:excinuclease UvrABC nuclease subunit